MPPCTYGTNSLPSLCPRTTHVGWVGALAGAVPAHLERWEGLGADGLGSASQPHPQLPQLLAVQW